MDFSEFLFWIVAYSFNHIEFIFHNCVSCISGVFIECDSHDWENGDLRKQNCTVKISWNILLIFQRMKNYKKLIHLIELHFCCLYFQEKPSVFSVIRISPHFKSWMCHCWNSIGESKLAAAFSNQLLFYN